MYQPVTSCCVDKVGLVRGTWCCQTQCCSVTPLADPSSLTPDDSHQLLNMVNNLVCTNYNIAITMYLKACNLNTKGVYAWHTFLWPSTLTQDRLYFGIHSLSENVRALWDEAMALLGLGVLVIFWVKEVVSRDVSRVQGCESGLGL